METIKSSLTPTVDRPDIAKTDSKPELTFKEVKDSLFKFLMQAGIEFSDPERISLKTSVTDATTGEVINVDSIQYTTTCRLLDVFVDDKPVYVVVLPADYMDLTKRHRNKLSGLKKQYKIVTFDSQDLHKIRLDISGKQWLKPLTKRMLKAWAKQLYNKISSLKGTVTSKKSLNDIYETIERNTTGQTKKKSLISNLEAENIDLRTRLRSRTIGDCFQLEEEHQKIIDSLVCINDSSTEWIEKLISFILEEIVLTLDIKNKDHKEFFCGNSKGVSFVNKNKVCEYVVRELKRKKQNLNVTDLGYGMLQVQNIKTFQVVTLLFNPTKSKKNNAICVNNNLVTKVDGPLVHALTLHFTTQQSKIYRIVGEVLLLTNYTGSFNFTKKFRLPVYDSKLHKYQYKLWSPY